MARKIGMRSQAPEKSGSPAMVCDTPMVKGLLTAAEKPMLVARMLIPRPISASQPSE